MRTAPKPLCLTISLALVVPLGVNAGRAQAKGCSFVITSRFPTVSATRVQRMTCDTAKAVGLRIQDAWAADQDLPTHLTVRGLRFRCRYATVPTEDNQYKVASCRRPAKPKVLVVLRLTS
jgi:hypothetical protein